VLPFAGKRSLPLFFEFERRCRAIKRAAKVPPAEADGPENVDARLGVGWSQSLPLRYERSGRDPRHQEVVK
jgi:hypothetical protein